MSNTDPSPQHVVNDPLTLPPPHASPVTGASTPIQVASTSPPPTIASPPSPSPSPDQKRCIRPLSMPPSAFNGLSISNSQGKPAVAICSYIGAPPGHLTFFMYDIVITQYRVHAFLFLF